jgi:predicted outer membrane repeat protein
MKIRLMIIMGVCLLTALQLQAATNTVTSIADSGSGTLRDAINTASAGNTIVFDAGLSGQTMTLTSGQLSISKTLTIDASMLPDGIIVSGNKNSRVLDITNGVVVKLIAMTIRDGAADVSGAATSGSVHTFVAGTDTLGGGIRTQGTLTLTNCTLTANSATTGGGVFVQSGTFTALACTFSSNSVTSNGGGLASQANAIVNECTFAGNVANGSHSFGGAIFSAANLTLESCTISGNGTSLVGQGGGIYRIAGTVVVSNCIVAGNAAAVAGTENLSGTMLTNGPNLFGSNPKLAAFGNYGGRTQTMPPTFGSPAIDGCTSTSFTIDQRGYPRILGMFADLGAVEGVFNSSFSLTNFGRDGNGNVQFSFTNLSGPNYQVLASTNIAAPLSTWSSLGALVESPAGVFSFVDITTTNNQWRFYRVIIP